MCEINIYIKPSVLLPFKEHWFKNNIQKILHFLDIHDSYEIGLVVTDNVKIKFLNKKYCNLDNPTDVLSFGMRDEKSLHNDNFILPPDGILHLGEIIISYPQAMMQAVEHNHDIKHELQLLLIHGILHLLGYDHENSPQEALVMREKEDSLLKKLSSSDSN